MNPRITADTVVDYLAACPDDQRPALTDLRTQLLEMIPGATEKISYGIPVFTYQGRGILGISSAARHASPHLMVSPPLERAIAEGIDEGTLSGSTLQFAGDQPLTEATVRLIVARRIAIADAPR